MVSHRTILVLLVSLTACATPPAPPPHEAGVAAIPPTAAREDQLEFRLASGIYRCDMGQRVEVGRPDGEAQILHIGWTGKRYRLVRNPSHSGLPRYEDSTSGLVWIDLPWKGMLLDGRANRPLASDCIAG